MATVQGGQGGKQVHFLARNQAFRRQHSNLLALLGAWGPERPMRSIMEHAQGWCK
jgi:hypothetical protein